MAQEGQETPPEEGSGWGWGWLSEAAKVAKAAYDSNVKPALHSMESSTTQFVQDVARAIELDQEEEPEPTEAKEEQTKSPDSSYPQEQVPHTPDTTEEEPDDSLLSDAMGSIAYLGGMVKKLGNHIGDVNAVEESLKSGGKRLASAWEEAYQFITEDEERQQQPHESPAEAPSTPSKPVKEATPSTPSAFPSTPGSAQSVPTPQRPSLASPTFASLFEAKLGQVHFATLENMSMQSSLQLQQIVRKLTDSQRTLLTKQQDELRAIYAEDVVTNALDLESLQLPGEGSSASREKFQTQLTALNQKLAFYASRTASLQGFALKAVAEGADPESGSAELKALSEGTLNYRGKMQLEGLRQIAEFCALAVHQILLAAEFLKERYEENPAEVNLVEQAKLIHGLALTTKELIWNISSQIVASMKALGNAFKTRVPNAQADADTQAVVQSTLKRISSGINNLQLDLATAASQILDASRFTLALVQHFEALNTSVASAPSESQE